MTQSRCSILQGGSLTDQNHREEEKPLMQLGHAKDSGQLHGDGLWESSFAIPSMTELLLARAAQLMSPHTSCWGFTSSHMSRAVSTNKTNDCGTNLLRKASTLMETCIVSSMLNVAELDYGAHI